MVVVIVVAAVVVVIRAHDVSVVVVDQIHPSA